MQTELWSSLLDAVPQWYTASCGPNETLFEVGSHTERFYSPRGLTPALRRLRYTAENRAARWLETLSEDDGEENSPFAANVGESFQESLVLKWLRIASEEIAWEELLAHARELRHRTYENEPVALNLVIGEGNGGSEHITAPAVQKMLDPLLRSAEVYVRTDAQLRFVEYGETPWPEASGARSGYRFHPEFLQPLVSSLRESEFGAHLTSRGDFVILGPDGLLASWRKGGWHLYDVQTLKNGFAEAINGAISPIEMDRGSEEYRVGCNLFEVALDLSYLRHGALLVYDPEGEVADHVTNEESLLAGPSAEPDRARAMLAPSVQDIQLGARRRADRRKRLFLELASMDGAVVFDGEEIRAFGAMIETHPDLDGFPGARTTAAWSALAWGGRPIKVSEDGDVEVLFRSEGPSGRIDPQARMRFL